MAQDQIPRLCDLLAPAVDALLGDLTGARREARMRYANVGRYGDLMRGWAAQAAVVRARLAKEVIAARRKLASGEGLADLAKSEFFAELPSDPQKAIGRARLVRTVVKSSPLTFRTFASGVVPAGTRIKRPGDPAGAVPSKDAEYETIEPVVCSTNSSQVTDAGGGNFTHTQFTTVKIRALAVGAQANTPTYIGLTFPAASVEGKLFDAFSVDSLTAAGGSLGAGDEQLKALALALSTGSAGPSRGAAIAGALTNPSVRRAVWADDPNTGFGKLFIADESWAASDELCAFIRQALDDKPWRGFGCRIGVLRTQNQGITVSPNVLLRGSQFIADPSSITAAIRTALAAYFDDRPDWYTWRLNAIGGVIAGADPRILACTGLSVLDQDGNAIASIDESDVVTGDEPPATIDGSLAQVTHYGLIGRAVSPTYASPG